MHFGTKSYLKSNRYHTPKHDLKDFGYKGLVVIILCNQTNNKKKTFNASYFLVLKVL